MKPTIKETKRKFKDLHNLIKIEDIQLYCDSNKIDLQNLISQPYSHERKKKIETMFFHFTQTIIKEDELIAYIISDHEKKYRCSVNLNTKLKEIGALESVQEIKERINDMLKVKAFSVVNNLEYRDELYYQMMKDIADQYQKKDIEKQIDKEKRQKELESLLDDQQKEEELDR